jgi:GST-like protein
MWTLFGSNGSGSAAVEAALLRCRVPFRRVVASTWEPGEGLDKLRRANPLAQIPTLQFDDGRVMTESAAILIHLGLLFPASALLPDDPFDRAQAICGLVCMAANCYAAIGVNDYPERWLPEASEADQFPAPATGAYGGTRPGALDLLVAVVSRWSGARAHLQAHRPGLSALVQRVDADPEFRDLFLQHWPPAAAV